MDMTSSRPRLESGVFTGHVRNHQLASSFFGRLPAEIRQLIYAECWAASGSLQHVFHRRSRQNGGQDTTFATTDPRQCQSELGEPRLTHFPCCKSEDDDEEILAEYDCAMERKRLSGPRGKTVVVDEVWSNRFASPWMDHWRCEEAMREEWEMRDFEASAGVARSNRSKKTRTAFLGALLCCKRMYQEALPSLYAATTFIYTDLATAHHTLVSLPSPTTSLLRSLRFSLAVPYDVLHQHRYYSSPGVYAGPWAELCVKLSNMVRFNELRDVVIRLDLADGDAVDATELSPSTRAASGCATARHGADSSSRPLSRRLSNTAASGDGEHRMWWQVRERWILSAIRGMLARRLTVQLPERRRRRNVSSSSGPLTPPFTSTINTRPGTTSSKAPTSTTPPVREHDVDDGPEWMHPYQYFEGDDTPFKLERYRRCRSSAWHGMRVSSGGERSSWAAAARGSISSGSGSGARSGPPSPRTLLGFVSGTLNGPGNQVAAEMNGNEKNVQTMSTRDSAAVALEAMGCVEEGGKLLKVRKGIKGLVGRKKT